MQAIVPPMERTGFPILRGSAKPSLEGRATHIQAAAESKHEKETENA
jgi:hypothetical protein